MPADRQSIAIFGATGYTGSLIAHALAGDDAPLLLAGRDPAKLAALAAAIGGAETALATVGDAPSLAALARRASVVINCVGPFVDLGEPVVRAAIAAGADYIDTTGEQPFLQAIRVHDTWARAQEVAVIPALAFEIALADCGAALAAEQLDDVARVQITYVTNLQASQGTKRTALRMLQSTGLAYAGGQWIAEPLGRHTAVVELPEPVGRLTAVSFPSAEVMTIPRHVATPEVRTFMAVPAIAARLLSATAPALGALARSPLGDLGVRLLGAGTDGPDEPTRRRDVFHIAVDAYGSRRGKTAGRRVLLRGRDPYGLTAAIARRGARLLRGGRRRTTGVISPAMAFEPREFLEQLAADGLAYDTLPLASG